MKYLKRFTEDLYDRKKAISDEIRSYSENYLSYLLDGGLYKIVVVGPYGEDGKFCDFLFTCVNVYPKPNVNFKWGDVKDTLEPFIEMCNIDYKLTNIHLIIVGSDDEICVKEYRKDYFDDDILLRRVEFKIWI